MTAMTNQKLTLPDINRFKKRLEVANFWRLSKSIRLNLVAIDIVDHTIVFHKCKENNSDWFVDKLEMLQELNKARYSDGTQTKTN